jgi:uncharacterized protein YbjQ (UPF0145 family)
MSEWDGRGLPPGAMARLRRARSSGVRSSLLAVQAQAGLDAVGLVPVGEVMGCFVEHIGWQGYAGCGWYGGAGLGLAMAGYGPPVQTIVSGPGAAVAFSPYLDALNAGWEGAIGRMLAECSALGGDGVVGVRLQERHLDEGNREFSALGTAVRALGDLHASRPFATTLDGQDVAKLLHDHWVPAGVIVAIAMGVRHDDYQTARASFYGAGNVEVSGYTDLVSKVRAQAREVLRQRCARLGADGAVLTTPMWMSIHELEVAEGHTDHAAEAGIVATALSHFGRRGSRPRRAPTIQVLPLAR